MTDEAIFVRRILEEPDSDGPRFVFADWLTERGDPRGEFIRLQCALARLPEGHPNRNNLIERELELRRAHAATWTKALQGRAERCRFRRGLVEVVSLTARTFVEWGAELLALAPIRQLRVTQYVAAAEAFADCTSLSRIRDLDLSANEIDDENLAPLVRSPNLTRLQSLSLSANGLTDRSAPALARLRTIESLDVSHNHFHEPVVLGSMAKLVSLDLDYNEVSSAAIAGLLQAPRLQRLRLAGNPVGDIGAAALIVSPRFAADGKVNLSRCGLGPQFMRSIVSAPNREQIRSLFLNDNAVGDVGLRTLLRASEIHRLTRLALANNGITDRGAEWLAGSELFPRLAYLDLKHNQLSAHWIRELWGHNRRNIRSTLNLADNSPSAEPTDFESDEGLPLADDES